MNDKSFFSDDRMFEMTITANFRKLLAEKLRRDYQENFYPATISCLFPDSTRCNEPAEIRARGDFRREECFLPPLLINFKTEGAIFLKKLGRLKLVWPCGTTTYDEQLVLKEYLVYKMFNLVTDKSFRVRLVKISYEDIKEKIKSRVTYGFFVEKTDEMAKRNNCRELDSVKMYMEQTNRQQATLVTLFQYMIGNTDWAVSVYHNIKLIRSRADSTALPFMVPFDFDGTGLVNADYAYPTPELGIANVRQRLYRGFYRTPQELNSVLTILRDKRKEIESLINTFDLLSKANKREMLGYLNDFYRSTDEDCEVEELFIKGARKE